MKITIKNLQKKIPVSPKRIKKVILNTLDAEEIKKPCRINVCFTGDREIKVLNRRYLKINRPTDVLVFDMSAGGTGGICADIIVSTDTALRNARIFKTLPIYEVCLYVVHGILHILGYDDLTPRQRRIMDNKARRILLCPSRKAIV